MVRFIPITFLLFWLSSSVAQTVNTVAGTLGVSGSANGTGTSASFNSPHGIACDAAGNIYVADRNNNKIRKITPAGVVTTFAGSGVAGSNDGIGLSASFFEPWGIACDNAGNLFVADTKNYKIRKITPAGVVTTIAGAGTSGNTNGPAATAQFGFPTGITVALNGDIFITEFMTHTIRKLSGGTVSTMAGTPSLLGDVDATGAAARFNHPHSIAVDVSGNLYVVDAWNNKVRKVTQAGVVTTFAGTGVAGFANGPSLTAQFNQPWGITIDNAGALYIGDVNNFLIRKIAAGNVTTYAGTQGVSGSVNGPALSAEFNSPTCMAFFPPSTFYVGDEGNELIRSISTQAAGNITLAAQNNATTFCTGTPVTITATPAGLLNYVFKDGPSIIGTNNTGVLTISNFTVGVHSITCTAGSSSTSSPLVITIVNAGTATVSPAGPVTTCAGNNVTLTASQGLSYLWSNNQTTQSISPTTSGNYVVTVTYGPGCTSVSAPVSVTVNPKPIASISPAGPINILSGQSATLTANTSSGYLWSTNATTQSISVSASGYYWLKVKNAAGCWSEFDSVQVIVSTPSSVTITAGGPTNFCPGDSVMLSSSQASGNQWYKDNVAIPGATSQTLKAMQTGSYKTVVTFGATTLTSNAIVVSHKYIPTSLVAHDATVCKWSTAELLIDPQTNVSYTWYEQLTGGTAIATGNGFITPALPEAKTYYAEINSNGCKSLQRFAVNANLYAEINPSFTNTDAVKGSNGYSIAFTNTTSSADVNYLWNFGDNTTTEDFSQEANPVYSYPAEGDYVVTLISTDGNSCVDTTFKTVSVYLQHDLFLPSAFTPNNDGINDIFRLKGTGYTSATMVILNQWGQVIFANDNAAIGWDGNVKGHLVQNGTYAYMVKIKMKDGEDKLMKGNVSVIK